MKRSLEEWIELHRKDVVPSISERKHVGRVASRLELWCRRAIDDSHLNASVVIGGSYAHDTWLPGEGDIDVYLVFPAETGRKELENRGLQTAKKALVRHKIILRYAEHPYVESFIEGIRVNVVPCLASEVGQWLSAADRSPYHTEYLNKRLDENQRFHIRLLKRFLKKQELYGAEIRVRGFSGYVCEVLILKFKTLPALLLEAQNWNNKTTIAVESHVPEGDQEEFRILDPVDPTRNLAAAISVQKLAEFTLLSRMVLGGTERDPFSVKLVRGKNYRTVLPGQAIIVRFTHSPKPDDILWGELWKSAEGIARHLAADGFGVLNWSVEAGQGRCYLGYLLERGTLSGVRIREGPYYYMGERVMEFLKSEKTIAWWIDREGRALRLERRSFVKPIQAIEHYMGDPVARTGFARGLAEDAKKSWKLLEVGKGRLKDPLARSALSRLFGYEPKMDSDN